MARDATRPAAVVSLLGRFRVATAEAVMDEHVVGRRAQIAFARLAVESGRSVSRELLADAVWGERVPVSWRPALRNVIAEVRRGLSASGLDRHIAVESAEGVYRLALPPNASVDLLVLRKAADD